MDNQMMMMMRLILKREFPTRTTRSLSPKQWELIVSLRQAVLVMAPEYGARAIAPHTFAELMASSNHCHVLPVWEGASSQTIWGTPQVNHAFRAWHDATHIAGEYPFTLSGEYATYEAQLAALRYRYPRAPRLWQRMLHAEIVSQAQYHAEHGHFPEDQLQFTLERIGP